MPDDLEARALHDLWTALGGASGVVGGAALEGDPSGLPSVFAVGEAAVAEVTAATLAAAELLAARTGKAQRAVAIDRQHVMAAFRSERFLRVPGAALSAWDPLAGDYEARDGWIRLHTSYASHRDAALHALGVRPERAEVARRVRTQDAGALEQAVVDAGGCAAAMRTRAEWERHEQGQAVAAEPLVHVEEQPAPALTLPASPAAPLAGVRVLDLTRVIAGPVCTRFLAAYGADVVRVDPPGFEEVGALLGETTGGKRRVALDLRAPDDRRAFERLVDGAHVLVSGYRSDALERLGYGLAALRARRPLLVVASLDAYGWTGPWRARRGFDSLVQMSVGIAARGMELAKATAPKPLPAQALDHGTGYLLAAATCRALTRALQHERTSHVRVSLARAARWLVDLGEHGDRCARECDDASPWTERVESAWGPLERVRCPGRIEGIEPAWTLPPGPLGVDAPSWSG